jgi:hypothetical protein
VGATIEEEKIAEALVSEKSRRLRGYTVFDALDYWMDHTTPKALGFA